jgi:recombination protein RecR
MSRLPPSLNALVTALSRLPGIGPRSAERIALHLVQAEPSEAKRLAETIRLARERVRCCDICGALTETSPCAICSDASRDRTLLCVVERPVDVFNIEKSGVFRGLYHVLGGKISPLDGVEPEDLRIRELEARLKPGSVREVILALSTDVEGDATSYYLAKRLARPDLRISRIAYGLPAGSGLEYADELTLSRAIEGRRELT